MDSTLALTPFTGFANPLPTRSTADSATSSYLFTAADALSALQRLVQQNLHTPVYLTIPSTATFARPEPTSPRPKVPEIPPETVPVSTIPYTNNGTAYQNFFKEIDEVEEILARDDCFTCTASSQGIMGSGCSRILQIINSIPGKLQSDAKWRSRMNALSALLSITDRVCREEYECGFSPPNTYESFVDQIIPVVGINVVKVLESMSGKGAILAVNKKLMDAPSHDRILLDGAEKVSTMGLLTLCFDRTYGYDEACSTAAARLAHQTMREIKPWYHADFEDSEDWWANHGFA